MPGSHGSMTKAGKVRQQTPKIESTGVNATKKSIPRKRFRKLFKKRIIKGKFGGQLDSIAAKKAKYRS
ncbi:MAG: 30S ribosomal protein S30e [Candidatus Lokiarchaeota archaeon]